MEALRSPLRGYVSFGVRVPGAFAPGYWRSPLRGFISGTSSRDQAGHHYAESVTHLCKRAQHSTF